MKRLTKRDENGEAYIITEAFEFQQSKMPQIIEKLAEYEDLEEQERLIKLPCKIGTPCYFITSENTIGNGIIPGYFSLKDVFNIGKTVFLTLEEAIKKINKKSNIDTIWKEYVT